MIFNSRRQPLKDVIRSAFWSRSSFYTTIKFSDAFEWLASVALQSSKCNCVPQERRALAFDWFFVSLETFPLRCVHSFFIWFQYQLNCAFWIDFNMRWVLIVFFVKLFWYTWLLSFLLLLLSGLLLLLSRVVCNLVSEDVERCHLTEFFSRLFCSENSISCWFCSVIYLVQFWWNFAFWIKENLHWALIDLFLILFCIHDLKFSAAAFEWLATLISKNSYLHFCASRKTSAGLWLSLGFLET